MSGELLRKAKSGDFEAFKALLNQSLRSQGISVKSIDIDNSVMSIELRSVKGKIEQSILDKIKSNTEKLEVDTVERVRVYQYQSGNSSESLNSNKHLDLDSSQVVYKSRSEKFSFNSINQIYSNDSTLKNFGIILFLLGFIMMGIGFIYDPSVRNTYNIGAISFKETYTNTGGFIAICGSIFIVSSRRKLDR